MAQIKFLKLASGVITQANTSTDDLTMNSFTGDGSALTSLNATNISSGTLADARLTSNVALIAGSQTLTNKTIDGDSNVIAAMTNAGSPNGSISGIVGEYCFDTVNENFYINTDGSTGWQLIGGGGVSTITEVAAGSGMTGGGTSGSVTLNVIGGTGITANADSIEIDTSVVADLTTAQTLSSKTLTSPVLNGSLSGTAFIDDDSFASASATTVASSESIKAYVDSVASGLDVKESVRAHAASNITLSGVQTIDGVSVVAGNRVLVSGQTTATQDGIYVASATAWSRASDLPVGASAAGVFCFVEEGTVYADVGLVCTNNVGSDVVGTDGLAFTEFSKATDLSAGDGISIATNTVSVDLSTTSGLSFNSTKLELDDSVAGNGLGIASKVLSVNAGTGLEISGDNVQIDSTVATLTGSQTLTNKTLTTPTIGSFTNAGHDHSDASNGGTIAISSTSGTLAESRGGTNQTTYAAGDILYASAADTLSKLAKGSDGEVLTLASGVPSWGAAASSSQVLATYTAGTGGIAAFDAVYVSANNTILKADASALSTARVIGIAPSAITAAASGDVVTNGLITGVSTGWTAGNPVYLSTTSGALTQTAPSGSGEVVIKVGIAKNGSDLQLNIGEPFQLAA